ncbi:MAG: UbiA family prenyltransferase, partial [Thermoanaerobaculia bacterium]
MNEVATSIDPAAQTAPASLSFLDLLRVSRAGLIVSHLWIYLVPAIEGGLLPTLNFWVGLVYVTVPLGLLIYGWNDFFDWDVDHISPRKHHRAGAAAFGPSLTPSQLASLPRVIVLAQLPFAVFWAVSGRLSLVGCVALLVLGNALYNGPGVRLSRIPVLAELTATGIYLLITWLGVLIHSPAMPAWIWLFAALSILNFQIVGALVDVEEDAVVGKRTFAVAFGPTVSMAAVMASLLIKAGLTYVFT